MGFDVVLLPSFVQVDWWRKRAAGKAESGLFGQVVATFDAWVADLWELHGDGRALVDGVQREMFIRRAAKEVAEVGSGLAGVAPIAVRCARLASGVEAFERAVEAARSGTDGGAAASALGELSAPERDFLASIARYEDLIEEAGLIEQGEAAAELARNHDRVFARPVRVLVAEAGALTWVQEQFFAQCSELEVEVRHAEGAEGVGRVPDGVEMRFAFPSGRLAQPGLVADCIEAMGDGAETGDIVVACKDPIDLFNRLERRFGGAGRRLRMQASRPFPQTDFGRAALACRQALVSESLDRGALSDAVGSFFSGFSSVDAERIDEALRRDRIAQKDETFDKLRGESELFAQLEQLVSGEGATELADVFAHRVRASGASAAWRAEQLAAIGYLKDALEASARAGLEPASWAEALETASVSSAAQVGESGPSVLVATLETAAAFEPGSSDSVILTDLTTGDYPVADRDDAASTLFASIGLSPEEPALERARREFRALLRLPSRRIVLMRPLGDENADETYPCAVLEELIDEYREDPSNANEVKNDFRLPASLQGNLVTRGEELLFANASSADPGGVQAAAADVSQPRIDDLEPGDEPHVMKPRYDREGNVVEGACPSPSQIEAYLECPYQWFASRRMNIGELDEGFGPLERGNFAHAVFEEFYQRFQKAGYAKVNEDNLGEVRDILRTVAAEVAMRQCDEEPGKGRLVAASELERRDLDAFCEQLVDYLDFEAKFLPTFRPAYFEYEIDLDHAVDYAGHKLIGKVDRIDIDDASRAVILDYKGSVGSGHEIGGKTTDATGKVQTRIYAQAVKRALGLDVVGAFYVSYGRKHAAAGAFDPRAIEAAHLPGMSVGKCSCGTLDEAPDPLPDDFQLADLSFGAMLDATEGIAARAIADMEAGEIPPRPSKPDSCRYCPVVSCPKRGA